MGCDQLKRWEEENPDWLTARLIEKIPDKVFTVEDLDRLTIQG